MIQVPTRIQNLAPDQIKVETVLENFVPSMLKRQFATLEASIVAEGCKTPLIVWDREGEYILVDGHNRLKICTKHGVGFLCELRTFENYEAVKNFMLSIQFGRRNMNGIQEILMRGQDYANSKNSKTDSRSGGVDTAELLAQKYTRLTGESISGSTIRRNEKTFLLMQSIKEKRPLMYENIIQFNIESPTHIEALNYLPEAHAESFSRLSELQENRPDLYDSEHIKSLINDFVKLGKEAKESHDLLLSLLDKLNHEEFKAKILEGELRIANSTLQDVLAYPRPNQEAFIKTYIETKNFYDAWDALKRQMQIFKPEPAPEPKTENLSVHGGHSNFDEEEEEEEVGLTPEEKEIIEGIRAIHPALADQFENGEIVCEYLTIHAKLFKHPEELQKVYFDAFFETQSIEQAYNIFHEHRQKAQEYPKEKEPEEEQKEPNTAPAQPLVIKSYPAQHDVFVVYGVNTLTGKNKLQNAVVDFVRQYINLAFNDFTAIYEGVEKELDRLNSLYKNCAPLKVGKRESEHGASIWITPKDSTVSFEASILCKKITKILEGASLGESNGTPSQQTQPTAEERKTQINLLMLYKLKKMEMEGFNKVCILRVEGNKVMEFISFRENQMDWVEMLELESNAQAKKEMDRICDKNPYCIKLNF